jgi:hypothetical protein
LWSLVLPTRARVRNLGERVLSPKLNSNILESLDYAVGVFIGHAGIDGQRDAAVKVFLGDWEISGLISPLPLVVGLKMQGDKVNGHANSALTQFFNHLIAMNSKHGGLDQDNIEVPSVLHI